jgi:DNA-binding LytR/AlgR family response regulator
MSMKLFVSRVKKSIRWLIQCRIIILIDTPLVDLEAKLNPQQFVRVHRAHLVAIDYIAEIQRLDAGRLMCLSKR